MKHILFFIAFLAAIVGYSQSTKIIGATPPQYVVTNRPATKKDMVILVTSNATGDLSTLTDSLGGRSSVFVAVTKADGVLANVTLPTIQDTIIGTKIRVKLYAEDATEQIGVFQGDLGFVIGYDGTQFVDEGTLVFVNDLEEFTFTAVEDVNGFHWAFSKTHSIADGNGIYSGTDSLSQTNTLAKMAADGSQTFALGYFPSFPFYDPNEQVYGYYNSIVNGENILLWGEGNSYNYNGVFRNSAGMRVTSKTAPNQFAQLAVRKGSFELGVGLGGMDKYWRVEIDTSKFEITRNISGTNRTYQLLPASQYPSTTSGVTNILKWTAGVPSFGLVPNIYNEDGHVPNNETRTLYLDSDEENYMRFDNASSGKQVNFNFAHDPNNNYSPYADMFLGYDKGSTYHGNSFFRISGGIFTGGPAFRYSDRIEVNSFGERAAYTLRSLTYGSNDFKHLVIGGKVDSVGWKNSFGGISISWDSLSSFSLLKKVHFTGFSRGTEDLQIYKNKGNKSWLVQTLYGSNPIMKNFDWIKVKSLDGDSTGHNVEFYGKYSLANATPGTGLVTHTWNNGTPAFTEIKRDTTVSYNNLDYNLLSSGLTSTQVKNRYNNIIITGYVPSSGVSSDALLFLPAPSADYNQVTIYLTAYDENATYGIGISATTNGIAYGDGTYGDAYPGGAIPVGAEVKIRCKIDPKSGSSTYKWYLN